jgi:hypothetical protein
MRANTGGLQRLSRPPGTLVVSRQRRFQLVFPADGGVLLPIDAVPQVSSAFPSLLHLRGPFLQKADDAAWLQASAVILIVPRVEGCRPVRGYLRSRSPDLRYRRLGSLRRPLAPDPASDRWAAPDVDLEAGVRVLGDGQRDGALEAPVPV